VTGVQQTYHQFHHENVARVFTPELTILAFAGRILIGIPTILLVKFCSKALAKWILPITASALGIPVRSSRYVAALTGPLAVKRSNEVKQSGGYLQKFSRQESFDVDTSIRLLQYAGLAWSVVDLVPSLFSQLNL
nr:lipid phosphate phosphatase delta-like [Tanacetum cinerariifolium]